MDALFDEIEQLRRMKQTDGKLSRSNEQLLKNYKASLPQRTGAAVIYPEDRLRVPASLHREIIFLIKNIDWLLKEHYHLTRDSRLFYLMLDIFNFEVEESTIARYYYMSKESERDGK